MSTRSVIARPTASGGFSGRYHHFDGYPSGVGRQLWHLYHQVFDRDLDRMLTVLLDEHPAGWSTIIAEWVGPGGDASDQWIGPECYCHVLSSRPPSEVTEQNAEKSGCEYAYVLGKWPDQRPRMHILVLRPDTPKLLAEVKLDGAEPDWKRLDKKR